MMIPSQGSAEWHVKGPMMTAPDWLDAPAYKRSLQEEADATEAERRQAAQEAWEISEQERVNALPRRAETISADGAASLSFGCSLDGEMFVAVVLNGYQTEKGVVRVTHQIDQRQTWRNPWYAVAADLELRAFSDRRGFVDQFMRSLAAGRTVTLQIETFPTATFLAPDSQEIVRPILENCGELSRKAAELAEKTMIDKEIMPEEEAAEPAMPQS